MSELRLDPVSEQSIDWMVKLRAGRFGPARRWVVAGSQQPVG